MLPPSSRSLAAQLREGVVCHSNFGQAASSLTRFFKVGLGGLRVRLGEERGVWLGGGLSGWMGERMKGYLLACLPFAGHVKPAGSSRVPG